MITEELSEMFQAVISGTTCTTWNECNNNESDTDSNYCDFLSI